MAKKPTIYIESTAALTLPSGKTIYTRTWVKDIQKLLIERSATAAHRMALEITKELHESTSQVTGLAAYSWFTSIGTAETGVSGLDTSDRSKVSSFRYQLTKGNANLNRRKWRSLIASVKKDWQKAPRKKLNIVNNVYYVDSMDRRDAFVEDAVNRGIATAEEKLKL